MKRPTSPAGQHGRRVFLSNGLLAAGSVVLLPVIGCGGGSDELDCSDVSALDAAAREARRSLGYVDRAPDASKRCSGCALFTAHPGQCGSCSVVRGPISPDGTCTAFSPKTA